LQKGHEGHKELKGGGGGHTILKPPPLGLELASPWKTYKPS